MDNSIDVVNCGSILRSMGHEWTELGATPTGCKKRIVISVSALVSMASVGAGVIGCCIIDYTEHHKKEDSYEQKNVI